MIARSKLEGIDGELHQEWILRLDPTTLETLPDPNIVRKFSLQGLIDSMTCSAWPRVIRRLISLIYFANE